MGGFDGEANDTSLGNFNFAEITVGLIRIKRSPRSAFLLLSSFALSLHHPLLTLLTSRESDVHRQPPATLYDRVDDPYIEPRLCLILPQILRLLLPSPSRFSLSDLIPKIITT